MHPGTQSVLEGSYRANLHSVRVHTDTHGQDLTQSLSARAVTYGNHIFLGPGERQTDLRLMAHETAHVLQQRAAPAVHLWAPGEGSNSYEHEAHQAADAVMRHESFNVQQRTAEPQAQRLGMTDALDFFADKANMIPGFRMFTIVIGMNPINGATVDRSPGNIIRAIVEFLPGGGLVVQALENSGVFDKVGNWVAGQLKSLGMVGSSFAKAISDFLKSLSWKDIFNLGGVWERAKAIFTGPISQLINFVKGLITGIIQFIKDAILKPLAKLAEGTEGYNLLKGILGKDPITGEAVPRSAETLLGPLLKMIGLGDVWQKMQQANAIPRAWAWFQSTMGQLVGFVSQIPGLFISAFKALTIEDIILVPKAFAKLAAVFGGFIGKFVSWGVDAMFKLLEIVFDVVSPGAFGYIKKTGGALKAILKNPLPFVGNLVKAAKLGFTNFAGNILGHLKKGLIDWLTGSLEGVYIPKALSLVEFGKLAISVLGVSWAQIRGKIVKALGPGGETIMKVLETTFDIVVALVTGGPAAAWDVIKDKLTELKDTIVDGVISFIKDTIVTKAIPKLIAMFIPGAGFISAIISIYDTVMVFINKISKIIQVVTAFVNSIVAIAAGNIGAAAAKVESILSGLLSLAISFLAGFVGLGKVTDKIMGVINKVRARVDKAIDTAVTWIVTQAKRLGKMAVAGAKGILLKFTQKKSFSASDGAHQMWITESGEPQVATTAMPLGRRLGTWKTRTASLPAADQGKATSLIGTADGLNGDLRKAAADALKARAASNAPAVDAAQAIIDSKQTALQPVLAALFQLFGDTATAGGAADEARIFALVEAYDQVVVPLKKQGLVSGSPATVSKTFRSQRKANQWAQARGWITQMERVLAVAKNVGTGRVPYLVGVEVKIPGTEIDYTVRDKDKESKLDIDVAVEVKTWGSMRDRPKKSGGTLTVAEQIQQRINTLRNQVQSSLRNPVYTVVVLEVRGLANIPPEFRSTLMDELINYRGLAASLNKRFSWRRV
jgi:Domain of unknown function (DUF4157)